MTAVGEQQTKRMSRPPRGRLIFIVRAGMPLVKRASGAAEQGDGNAWTTGRCWLWCSRESTPVLQIGPASVNGVTAGVYACKRCVQVLADQIVATHMAGDITDGLDDIWLGGGTHGPPRGRHRRRS